MRYPLGNYVFVALSTVLLAACSGGATPKEDPDVKTAQINTRLGMIYLRDGNYEQSLLKLNKAIRQDPNNATAHSTLGLLHLRLGQMEEAEGYFKEAVRLDPKDGSIRNNYGFFLCRQKRLEEAEEQFMLAVQNPLYKSPHTAYANAGLCMLRVPSVAKAEHYFRKALQKNPRFPTALFQMAKITFANQNWLSARGYLQRYAEVAQHNATSLWMSVQVERELGDLNTAASHALLLKAKFPDSDETRQLLEKEKHEWRSRK